MTERSDATEETVSEAVQPKMPSLENGINGGFRENSASKDNEKRKKTVEPKGTRGIGSSRRVMASMSVCVFFVCLFLMIFRVR